MTQAHRKAQTMPSMAPEMSLFTHSQASAVVPVWYWVAHGTASSSTPTVWDKREI